VVFLAHGSWKKKRPEGILFPLDFLKIKSIHFLKPELEEE
jgi:hypothetical protein